MKSKKWQPKEGEGFWVITEEDKKLTIAFVWEGWLGYSYKDFWYYSKTHKQALSKFKEIKKLLTN